VDSEPGDVELLLASVDHEVAALRRDRRLSKAFDGNRGAALRQHVLDLIEAAEHRLSQKPMGEVPPAVAESFSRSLRDLMLNLRAAHAAMPWLAATQKPQVNLGSLYLTEEFAEILVGQSLDLVLVPDPEYMYSTESWPFLAVVERVSGFTPKTARRPVVLHYPLSDNNRLLLHAIFSHELGHSAVQEAGLVAKVASSLEEDDDYQRDLIAVVTALRKVWPANTDSKTARTLQAWLNCWIEELLCDHMAIATAGPSYLWAFAGFVLPLSYGSPYSTHPPNTLRTKLALDQLGSNGWTPYIHEKAPGISRWLSAVAVDTSDDLGVAFNFLRDQLVRRSDLLRDASEEVVGSAAVRPNTTVSESDEAVTLLRRLILPVGSENPLAARSILLGGWERAIEIHGDSPAGLVAALANVQLQDLVGKAIELSVVSACWEEE
jgi:hypothetical protein